MNYPQKGNTDYQQEIRLTYMTGISNILISIKKNDTQKIEVDAFKGNTRV